MRWLVKAALPGKGIDMLAEVVSVKNYGNAVLQRRTSDAYPPSQTCVPEHAYATPQSCQRLIPCAP